LQDVAAEIRRFIDRVSRVQTGRETVALQSEARIQKDLEWTR
jgi:hypothetical protein